MPTGTAIAVASATITILPTRAFATPPPLWPKVAAVFVKKSQLSALAARCVTEIITSASTATAASAARVASARISRLTSFRRLVRRLSVRSSGRRRQPSAPRCARGKTDAR